MAPKQSPERRTPVVIGKVFDLWPLYSTYYHLSAYLSEVSVTP